MDLKKLLRNLQLTSTQKGGAKKTHKKRVIRRKKTRGNSSKYNKGHRKKNKTHRKKNKSGGGG